MSDDRFEAARERIDELREETRQYLADGLGGDPEDYRHDADADTNGDGDSA